MFCHSCGAKNNEGSRFCNMCGAPMQSARGSLDQTQLGVGSSPELELAIADSRRASSAPPEPRSSSPGTTQRSKSLDGVITGVESTQRAPDGFPPIRSDRPPSGFGGAGSMKTAAVPEGFDPSLSVQLDAIGIRSPRRMWTVAAIAGAALLLVGGLSSYFVTRDDPSEGHAQAGDPFEIGAPTAEVDFVSGSNGRPTETPTPNGAAAPVDAGVRGRGEPPMNLTTNGVVTQPSAPTTATPTPSTTTGAPTSMGSTSVPATAMTSAPALPSLSTPVAASPFPTATPPTTVTPPPSTSTAVTPPPATGDTTTATETTPEMDAEMYAARVRYLVRRYYAGRAQTCFSAATSRNETVSGQVVIGMHIGADGHVTSARVARNTTGDDALGSCLADQASSWELAPPPGGSADLSFPFSR